MLAKLAVLFFLFLAALLLCQAALQFIFRKQMKMNNRMETFIAVTKEESEEEKDPSFLKEKSIGWLNQLRDFLASKTSRETKSELEKKLQDAGYPKSWTAVDFRIVQFAVAGTLFFLSLLVFGKISDKALSALIFSVVMGALGYYYPLFSLSARKKKRLEMVEKSMAEFFDMVNLSVEAGMGMDAAIIRVCKNTKGPLSEEFLRAIEDMRLGKSRRDAFVELRNRIPVESFQSIMTSLIQADQIGIGLSKVLGAMSERIREYQRQMAREKAMKAPVKMIFPMILFIFPSIFIVLLGPLVIYFLTNGFK